MMKSQKAFTKADYLIKNDASYRKSHLGLRYYFMNTSENLMENSRREGNFYVRWERSRMMTNLILAPIDGEVLFFGEEQLRSFYVDGNVDAEIDQEKLSMPSITKIYRFYDSSFSGKELFLSFPLIGKKTKYYIEYNEKYGLHGIEPNSGNIDVFSLEMTEKVRTVPVDSYSYVDEGRFMNCHYPSCEPVMGKHWLDLVSKSDNAPLWTADEKGWFCDRGSYDAAYMAPLRMVKVNESQGRRKLSASLSKLVLKTKLLETDKCNSETVGGKLAGMWFVAVCNGLLFGFRMDATVQSYNRMYNLVSSPLQWENEMVNMTVFIIDLLGREVPTVPEKYKVMVVAFKDDTVYSKAYGIPRSKSEPWLSGKASLFSHVLELKDFRKYKADGMIALGKELSYVTLNNDKLYLYDNDGSMFTINVDEPTNPTAVLNQKLYVRDSLSGSLHVMEWSDFSDQGRIIQRLGSHSVRSSTKGLVMTLGRSETLVVTDNIDSFDSVAILHGKPYVNYNGTEVHYGLKGCILFATSFKWDVFLLKGEGKCVNESTSVRVFLINSTLVLVAHEKGSSTVSYHARRMAFKEGSPYFHDASMVASYAKINETDLENESRTIEIMKGMDLSVCYSFGGFLECLLKLESKMVNEDDPQIIAHMTRVNLATDARQVVTHNWQAYPEWIRKHLMDGHLKSIFVVNEKHLVLSLGKHGAHSLNEALTFDAGKQSGKGAIRNVLPCIDNSDQSEVASWNGDMMIYHQPSRRVFKFCNIESKTFRKPERKKFRFTGYINFLGRGEYRLEAFDPMNPWFENYMQIRSVNKGHMLNEDVWELEPEKSSGNVFRRIHERTRFQATRELTDNIECGGPLQVIFWVLYSLAISEVLLFAMLIGLKVFRIDPHLRKKCVKAALIQKVLERNLMQHNASKLSKNDEQKLEKEVKEKSDECEDQKDNDGRGHEPTGKEGQGPGANKSADSPSSSSSSSSRTNLESVR